MEDKIKLIMDNGKEYICKISKEEFLKKLASDMQKLNNRGFLEIEVVSKGKISISINHISSFESLIIKENIRPSDIKVTGRW